MMNLSVLKRRTVKTVKIRKTSENEGGVRHGATHLVTPMADPVRRATDSSPLIRLGLGVDVDGALTTPVGDVML